eukprot:Skav217513  [mRNA]  locus=scaffold647:63894:68907:+ [translate_table: standard]
MCIPSAFVHVNFAEGLCGMEDQLAGLSWELDSDGLRAFAEEIGEAWLYAVHSCIWPAALTTVCAHLIPVMGSCTATTEISAAKLAQSKWVSRLNSAGAAVPWFWHASVALAKAMTQEKKAESFLPGDDFSHMYFYGTVKSFTERGFGWLSCADTLARFGREVYLSKEEATALAKDPVVGTQFGEAEPVRDGQFVRFKVTEGEGYPEATQTRRVRRLLGEVLQLPGEEAADGILTVKGDPNGSTESLQQLMGKEVRIRQSDCAQLRLHVGDEVTFYCILIGDNPPLGQGERDKSQAKLPLW